MDISPFQINRFKVSRTNRYFMLALEVNRSFGIPHGVTMGLCKMKGIDNIEEIFHRVRKDELCRNRKKLFMYLAGKLPTIYKPTKRMKQERLKLK